MPYRNVLNRAGSMSLSDIKSFNIEFDRIRSELDDIRSAVAAIRALLVAGTAVGAGYNTAATNIGPAITATPQQTPRFLPLA